MIAGLLDGELVHALSETTVKNTELISKNFKVPSLEMILPGITAGSEVKIIAALLSCLLCEQSLIVVDCGLHCSEVAQT